MTGPIAIHGASGSATLAESAGQRHLPDTTGFDDLSPHERDQFLHEIELDFRMYLAKTASRTGFVIYPNTQKLLQAVSGLYETLAGIDFSDLAL